MLQFIVVPPVYAQDDDEEEFDFGEKKEEKGKKKKKEDKPAEEKAVEGGDTPEIYREAADAISKLSAEDGVIEWKKYLIEYPNSQFRKSIEDNIDKLEEALYSSAGIGEETGKGTDEQGREEQ